MNDFWRQVAFGLLFIAGLLGLLMSLCGGLAFLITWGFGWFDVWDWGFPAACILGGVLLILGVRRKWQALRAVRRDGLDGVRKEGQDK